MEYGVWRRGYVDHTRYNSVGVLKKLYEAKRWVVERTAF